MSEHNWVTLKLREERCEIADGIVSYTLSVEAWRAWLPAFCAALDMLPQVAVPVDGEG